MDVPNISFEYLMSVEVEENFLFLLNFYATFAAEGVPPLGDFKDVLGVMRMCAYTQFL